MSHERGQIAVCIAASGDADALVRCLASVVEHTPADVGITVCGEVGSRPKLPREVDWNGGSVADALAASAPADVAVVSDRSVVGAGWLEGLRDAAASDSLVATATSLSNHAAFLSVPDRNHPWRQLPQAMTLDDAAARVRERSQRVRPVIPVALGHCVLIRRDALELAGPFDALTPFSERCAQRGLRHVAADDVLVLHAAPADAPRMPEIRDAHLAALVDEVENDAPGPLGRALTVARQAVSGRRVTIDGRSLGRYVAGTQVLTLELIHALRRTEDVRVRVLVAPGSPPHEALEGVETVTTDTTGLARDEIVHRPFQVERPGEVPDLMRFGERLLLTQLDLIGYHTPGYFPSPDDWLDYRRLTREALALAHLVVFTTQHAADDALGADLVARERARVVAVGTDHQLAGASADPQPPAALRHTGDAPFLLCLGTDFRHKNRPFALRVLAALRERHGWEGRLVLAGPERADGSSAAEEAAWGLEHPGVRQAVVRTGAVSDAEKAWLYANAAAVIYPTLYEGFGFVPFEAADAGTPCLWAAQTSLAELLPREAATVVPWDAEATAANAMAVLADEQRAQQLVETVRGVARRLTWDRAAAALLETYDEAVRLPVRESARLAEAEMVTQSAYWGLRHDIGDTGMALVGPEDPLLPDDAQRALAALARRDGPRQALLTALRWAGRSRP